jgi:acetyl esterase/lipase
MRIAVQLAEGCGASAERGTEAVEQWARAAADLRADADHTEIARWVLDRSARPSAASPSTSHVARREPAMPLHPQAQALLQELDSIGGRPIEELPVLAARELDASFPAMQAPAPEVASVRDILVAGADGMLPARVYHPDPTEDLPVVVFFHGGGFVVGDLDVTDKPCRALAVAAHCVVVSVGYRLSPETKFPGPVEDSYAATCWVADHAENLGGTSGYLAVAGESAGGTLAAAVSLMSRDRGAPAINYQILIYPITAPARDSAFRSYDENGEGYMLTRRAMEWFWDHYLKNESDGLNPYASPLLATTFTDLPRALVITAEFDPLRDEAIAYARKLTEAGVDAEVLPYAGAIHGFLVMSGRLDHGLDVVSDVAARLRADFKSYRNEAGNAS